MPKPYSYDLRQKVIQAIKQDCLKISDLAAYLALIVTLLDYGASRERETGDFQGWSWLKSRIRKQIIQFDCLRDAMEAVLRTVA